MYVSGSIVNTRIIDTREIPAAMNMGRAYLSIVSVDKNPPSAGPNISAAPNTPDEMENTEVRVSGVEISAKDA